MTVDEIMSGCRSGEDLRRLYFRCLKCYSSTMNPLDPGWFGVYRGFRTADMAAAVSNFTRPGGDFVRLSAGRRRDDGRCVPCSSVAELELRLASLGF